MSLPITLDDELMFPSLYLGAADLKGKDVTLVIERIQKEDLSRQGGKKERKPVVSFRKTGKMLVLNKTNAASIAELYGNAAGEWVGKAITLYPTRTSMGPKQVDCIRIRPQVPSLKPAEPQ